MKSRRMSDYKLEKRIGREGRRKREFGEKGRGNR